MRPNCPKCLETEVIKRGFSGKKQRWMCKSCSFQFSRFDKRLGKPLKLKQEALRLYCTGLSLRAIGKQLEVANTTVLSWVKKAAEECQSTVIEDSQVSVVELDEFWHYIKKKAKDVGSSKQ